ncbi:NAD-dependent epimerase/dehydratase family protein, partial [Acinetobacter baumannii]
SGALDVFNAATPTQDGTPVRDYLHVRDLARAHAAALVYLRGGGPSRILNCGTGRGHSVLDVIGAVERHCGTPLPQRRQAPRQ